MPKPLAICIEEVGGESKESQYMRCVALPGRQLGLSLDGAGRVMWKAATGVSCELWVSADEQLILYRPADAVQVMVRRSQRTLDVPCDKPVVIIDKDEIDVGQVRLRIHVHGEAAAVAPPSAVVPDARSFGAIAKAAAAAAVLGALAATGCSDVANSNTSGLNRIQVGNQPSIFPPSIEVRNNPPKIQVRTSPPSVAEPPGVAPPDVAPPEPTPPDVAPPENTDR